MGAQTTNLLLLGELEDGGRTGSLPESDLNALRAVAEWIRTFVARPHMDLGRAGPVCPFVPGALERDTLWLVPERSAGRSMAEIVDLVIGYQRLFVDTPPGEADDGVHKAFFVVFTDLPADGAKAFFDDLLGHLAIPSYVEKGFAMGGFYEGNQATAIHNPGFRPFTSPVPSLLVRQTVVSDWEFFLDDDEWFGYWGHRFGESGARALGEELRRLPWRTEPD